MSKGKALTVELILTKTKFDNLSSIKNLNLWGNELQDLQIIQKMPNLEVISLSVNKICSLKDFAKCTKLQELYLRKNCIADLREISHLLDLPQLKSLWLYDNPCAQQENYREIVIHHLPNLNKLDNNVVSPEERTAAANQKYQINFTPQKQTKQKQRPAQQVREGKEGGYRVGRQSVHNESNLYILSRNKNVLIAVLSLLKELDSGSLQIVRKQVERQVNSR